MTSIKCEETGKNSNGEQSLDDVDPKENLPPHTPTKTPISRRKKPRQSPSASPFWLSLSPLDPKYPFDKSFASPRTPGQSLRSPKSPRYTLRMSPGLRGGSPSKAKLRLSDHFPSSSAFNFLESPGFNTRLFRSPGPNSSSPNTTSSSPSPPSSFKSPLLQSPPLRPSSAETKSPSLSPSPAFSRKLFGSKTAIRIGNIISKRRTSVPYRPTKLHEVGSPPRPRPRQRLDFSEERLGNRRLRRRHEDLHKFRIGPDGLGPVGDDSSMKSLLDGPTSTLHIPQSHAQHSQHSSSSLHHTQKFRKTVPKPTTSSTPSTRANKHSLRSPSSDILQTPPSISTLPPLIPPHFDLSAPQTPSSTAAPSITPRSSRYASPEAPDSPPVPQVVVNRESPAVPRLAVPEAVSTPTSSDGLRHKACNCKKSKCLKLYCECFQRGEFCRDCNCMDCHNQPQYKEAREKAIIGTLERDPNAFFRGNTDGGTATGVQKHRKGCHCKKSECLKKYCECFQGGYPCTDACKCLECKNGRTSSQRKKGKPKKQRQQKKKGTKVRKKLSKALTKIDGPPTHPPPSTPALHLSALPLSVDLNPSLKRHKLSHETPPTHSHSPEPRSLVIDLQSPSPISSLALDSLGSPHRPQAPALLREHLLAHQLSLGSIPIPGISPGSTHSSGENQSTSTHITPDSGQPTPQATASLLYPNSLGLAGLQGLEASLASLPIFPQGHGQFVSFLPPER